MEQLYRYQRRVYDALMRGRSVILQAPTGGGKTRAALYPFLENLERYGLHQKASVSAEALLPLTCRYAVPMRVLASQFEQEYRDCITTLDKRRDLRLRERYTDALGVPVPAIQTGETPDDPRFESPLTFCTIDQLLSSFIGSPYALGGRQANLNVGAVVGSYLVLDEFHLYPLEKGAGARKTTLAMLRLLSGFSRFVLMTATFSSRLLDELGVLLDAEVVRVTDGDELAEIMGDRMRTVQVSPDALSAEGILLAHTAACARGAGASLVVCNTVAQAQSIYAQLRDALAAREELASTRLQLLHSRFTTSDRQAKRERLEQWLGKDAWVDGRYTGASTIVVATQVVEVGLNISVGTLHTELAPANSIIQRAGRCARFVGQRGDVIIYHPLAPRAGEPEVGRSLADFGTLADEEPAAQKKAGALYLPYDREMCEATWRELVRRAQQGGDTPLALGFADEQALIDVVHADADAAMIADFRVSGEQTLHRIKESLRTHEPGAGTELIRDVANVQVIIHDDPESITTRPWDWDAFSLRPSTLLKHWDELCKRGETLGWVMMNMEPDSSPRDERDNSREPRYLWRRVSQEAHGAQISLALRLALPSALATYDAELGFR
ncbi:MAG TPA: CRISPR-associated helicase Cas3', partial [Ktedonobacterales bacterium]|nr:CRISPR-associated helicase Cas3' [Ktedonobacterales bacterium]